MTAYLLDVNVLVALMWPAHELHSGVQNWFARHARRGWATCPFTEAAFVRIISNPSFSPHAVTPQEATSLLSSNLKHEFHRFWTEDISFVEAIEPFRTRLVGHQQVSDAYLLGLAIHKKGTLATLDRAMLSLLPAGSAQRDGLELIESRRAEMK